MNSKHQARLPLLIVRDVVVFPHTAIPLSVARERSIKALEEAMRVDKLLAVTTQKKADLDDPSPGDIFEVGVLAEIGQFLKMPDGTLRVFIQGLTRIRLKVVRLTEAGFWEAELDYPMEAWQPSAGLEALTRQAIQNFENYTKLSQRAPPEGLGPLEQMDPGRLADTLASHAVTKLPDRQVLLETLDPMERLEKLVTFLNAEIEILNLERKIHTRVRSQIQKTQKEYYLTEQMKAIQKELRQKDDFAKELDELRAKIKEARMPKAAAEASWKELGRLEKMMPFSPESTVCRTYLDWMVGLPWSKKTQDSLDLERASKILDADHFGLEKAKERVLEYLAVCRLTKKLKGPILCFVGPPGVGKTSMGSSIARAMNRRFVRISLGGVRDEAEIRGHRRTYIGSLPGRIIQSLRKAQSRNPVFLLDEIDKMGMDWRGDPAAALLEVLDPEQNSTFTDHYLDVEFDLSAVLFICTANTLDGIPVSLQDRLEIVRFPGYTQAEKIAITKGYLIPKQVQAHGLKNGQISVSDAAIERTIQEYTREAGVRNLEREMANLCRKAAREIVEKRPEKILVDPGNLQKYLGIPKYTPEEKSHNEVGVATGLAWTEIGGQILAIEVLSFPGKGDIQLTGHLGSVMQESARAALSFIRSVAEELGVSGSIFKTRSFHIHVPEGAIPKDGPSAGIAIATALASHVSRRAVLPGIAMTGEITLRGRVLPIGGLKEKVLAAHRASIKTVFFPQGNRKDLEEIPKDVQAAVELIPVEHIHQVLSKALVLKKSSRAKPSRSSWHPEFRIKPISGYTVPQA